MLVRALRRLFIPGALLIAIPVVAQDAAPVKVHVPALTQLTLWMAEPVNSDRSKTGDRFHFSVQSDVRVSGLVVIPAGSRGEGEVIHAVDSSNRQDPGELVLSARFVTVGDRKVRLRSFVAGSANHANDALAVPPFDRKSGGGRGDPVGLGFRGFATARVADDVDLPGAPGTTEGEDSPVGLLPGYDGPTGTIVLFREWMLSQQRPPYALRENGSVFATIATGTYQVITVPVGVHRFNTRGGKSIDVAVDVEGGETYYIGCSYGQPKCAPSNQAMFEYMKHDFREARP